MQSFSQWPQLSFAPHSSRCLLRPWYLCYYILTQIISTTPGISLSQNGPVGSPTEINIRGYGSKYIKVFYDGIDIADVTGVEVKPIIVGIPSNNLKKIEILQGSQSALYGSEAVGGVLFLETKL